MIHPIVQRLESLGITLPEPASVAGNYVPFVVAGSLLSVSGQLPLKEGGLILQGCPGWVPCRVCGLPGCIAILQIGRGRSFVDDLTSNGVL